MSDKSDVFKTLSAINLNKLTSQKGKFTYLSWSDAWTELMNHYPDATHDMLEDVRYKDGTMEVRSSITIGGQTIKCFLPVIDHRNNAIENPNAFDVNKTRMRCLAKNIALWGLGLYIFRGEDLPQEPSGPEFTPDQQSAFNMLIANGDGWGIKKFAKGVDQSVMDGLFNSAPKGEKTALKSKCRELVQSANNELKDAVQGIQNALEGNDGDHITEILGELDDIEREFVMAALSDIEKLQMTNLQGE